MQWIYLILFFAHTTAFNKNSIDDCSRVLGENIKETFERVTSEKKIVEFYNSFVEPEQFDPRAELKRSKQAIDKYLARRAEAAYKAKISLEARKFSDASDGDINDPNSKDFIRFMSAKRGMDGTTIYANNHYGEKVQVNETRSFHLSPNANFYTLNTSSMASAVHVPTPLYDRNEALLRKIDWSDIDPVYRTHREETRDLAFQLFCSESGFMRFFPATSWFWDSHVDQLDMFDCRNTEWYISAATNSKNVLIMLDMSGSMLGQRYEIAKQLTEAILETLSHNDYFNIMAFSKTAYFLDSCNGTNGMLQATMRNKKLLRTMMNNITSEGKAEYEKALPHAFAALKNISSSSGRSDQGCENVIMLITDGAPNTYKETFDILNPDKRVRFFSYLIGEEAIDFDQVKFMACYNRGFMVHVQNIGDCEEKVQHYIRTMSRNIGQHVKDIGEDDALWSGVYRERLYIPRPEIFAEPIPITNKSYAIMNKIAARKKTQVQKTEARARMFVTTVSFPVIVNETFMGVAAVNIPLTEINQQAHPSNIGPRSYFFMLDQNGFVVFHPQLRPIDPVTKTHKQNYNNMDLLELEVPQTQQMRLAQPKESVSDVECDQSTIAQCIDTIRASVRKLVLDCDNSEPQEIDVFFASESLDRVYPQTNTYYSECINGANFVLGLAVAKGDDHRWRRKAREYNFDNVKANWLAGSQWRIHPHWRYCLLNDTDTNISKEEAFAVYAVQMKESGKLPHLCKPRQHLVEKLLVDLEATSALPDLWDMQLQYMKDNQIHLIFFTAPSGMIRFYNISLDAYDYLDPYWSIFDHIGALLTHEHFQQSYNNFVTDLNRKSVDDPYYRRSVRQKGDIIFSVSNLSKIWYKSETDYTEYGLNENMTMLVQATKAVFTGNAILGVTGYEFTYDSFVVLMSEHGCKPSNDRKWCVLLDEHAYILYSNREGISYEEYLAGNDKQISKFFGGIDRISQRVMALLVEKKFYTKLQYNDHQATCKEVKKEEVSSATSLTPWRWLRRLTFAFIDMVLRIFSSFSLVPVMNSVIGGAEGYTSSFHDMNENYPCTKESNFYLSNKNGRNKPQASVLTEQWDRPCTSAKCSVKVHASFVEGTNLVMVWVTQNSGSEGCYDETQCPMVENSEVKFGFSQERKDSSGDVLPTCDGITAKRTKRSKAMCYNITHEDTKSPCSPASVPLSLGFALVISAFYSIVNLSS